MTLHRLLRIGVAFGLSWASAAGLALAFPDRPIRLIVGYAPGGGTDNLARTLAKGVSERLGQSIVVENRPGANTIIAAQALQGAKPDGYTLMMVDPTPVALNPALYAALPYDPTRFEPVAQAATVPVGLLVTQNSRYGSVAEFLQAAKVRRLPVASAGLGNITHLAMELFQRSAEVGFTHVPYKGSAPAIQALLSGEVEAYFSDLASAMPHIQGGRLKYLAVSAPERIEALPSVPTFAELGLRNYQVGSWLGVVAPPQTDGAVVRKLAGAILETVNSPDMSAWMKSQSIQPSPRDAAGFGNHIRSEARQYGAVIKELQIKLD
jgi:tripartite-type tricarboxylate transporter receptor subunit TctC